MLEKVTKNRYWNENKKFAVFIYHNNNPIRKEFIIDLWFKSVFDSLTKKIPSNTSSMPLANNIMNEESKCEQVATMAVKS